MERLVDQLPFQNLRRDFFLYAKTWLRFLFIGFLFSSMSSCRTPQFNKSESAATPDLDEKTIRIGRLESTTYRPSHRLSLDETESNFPEAVGGLREAYAGENATGVFLMPQKFPGIENLKTLWEGAFSHNKLFEVVLSSPKGTNLPSCGYVRDSPAFLYGLGVNLDEVAREEITTPGVDLKDSHQEMVPNNVNVGWAVKSSYAVKVSALEGLLMAGFRTLDLLNAALRPKVFGLYKAKLLVGVPGKRQPTKKVHVDSGTLNATLPILGWGTTWFTAEQAERFGEIYKGSFYTEMVFDIPGQPPPKEFSAENMEDLDAQRSPTQQLLFLAAANIKSVFPELTPIKHASDFDHSEKRLLAVFDFLEIPPKYHENKLCTGPIGVSKEM